MINPLEVRIFELFEHASDDLFQGWTALVTIHGNLG